MNKKIILDRLKATFINEAATPGIKVTADINKKNAKINKAATKEVAKNMKAYDASSKKADKDSKTMATNKFNYNTDEEKDYHNEMEIMNGQEMIQYDREPNKEFKDRAMEAIEGSTRMGNNPEWANVVAKGQGGDPEFGKNLVKSIKASEKKRSQETPTTKMYGNDWEVTKDKSHKPYAFESEIKGNPITEAPMKPISDKNKLVLQNWVTKLGKQKAAEKLLDTLSATGMVSSLPDSMEYGNALNSIADLLESGKYDMAYHKAKSASARLEKKAMKDMMGETASPKINITPLDKKPEGEISWVKTDKGPFGPQVTNTRLVTNNGIKTKNESVNPENDEEDYEKISREVETGINPYEKLDEETEIKGAQTKQAKPFSFNDGDPKALKAFAKSDAKLEKEKNKTQLNKPSIKENKTPMKRLKFKNLFNGFGNALKLIPESYKVDKKVFEITDGNEAYTIRWEGPINEGKAIILKAADSKRINEDIERMKSLFNYKSEDTLGLMRGKSRINENAVFADIYNKTKKLLSEDEDIESVDAAVETDDDAGITQAADAKKHIEGSVPQKDLGGEAPAPKNGVWDEIKKPHAADAKKHVEGSVAQKDLGGVAPTPKVGEWEKISVPQAADAKKDITMSESTKKK